MFIVVLCIISGLLLTLYATSNLLPYYAKPKLEQISKDSKNTYDKDALIKIFKSKKKVQLKDKKFLDFQVLLNTSFEIDENVIYKLDVCLQKLYILYLKINYLRDLKSLSLIECSSYNEIVDKILAQLKSARSEYSQGYSYTGSQKYKQSCESIGRLESVINAYKIPTTSVSDVSQKKLDNSAENKSSIMKSIEDKHNKLDNVISKSLYKNAVTLNNYLKDIDLSEETVGEVHKQLNQIDRFLSQELKNKVDMSEADFINNLKVNQRYLDSLEVNWTSET